MIIASRTLKVRTGAIIADVPIRVFRPERTKEESWSCRYEIDWPDRTWTMTAFGIDGVQAVLNAFQMIGAEIYTSDYHRAGILFFKAPGHGYGFPVPGSLRHLLEGDDAGFF